ncbi:MAG TPA: hypothetical protein VF017_19825 [Thermoanaerobaculia bacterium]|nr:hypothetical protein [Thermoanaerobaculia bacterium]
MELIVTAARPSLDSWAAAQVARHLFPGACALPVSTPEPILERARGLLAGLLPATPDRLDPRALSRLILCGCRRADRLGDAAAWLIPGHAIELHVFDHHAASERDLPFVEGRIDPGAGTTSTLVVEALREAGRGLAAMEASVVLAGLYQATGGLCGEATGFRELAAAAWLMAQGASPEVARELVLDGEDAVSLAVLRRVLDRLEVLTEGPLRVGVAELAPGSLGSGIRLRTLARPLGLEALVILEAGPDTLRIAVERASERLALKTLLAAFAPNGDEAAVSFAVAGMPVAAVRRAVLEALARAPQPRKKEAAAGPRPLELDARVTVAAARRRLLARRRGAAWVAGAGGERLVVTLGLLEAAGRLGLEAEPAQRVALADVPQLGTEAPPAALARALARSPERVVAVGEPSRTGPPALLTPDDLLSRLDGGEAAPSPALQRARGILARADELLAPAVLERVELVRASAARLFLPVFLVGGPVRDLLLERPVRDLDLAVEGDAGRLVEELGKELPGEVRRHPEFLTATLALPHGARIDVASARVETYEGLAALPRVEASSIDLDLRRRDFSVNALALRLPPGGGFELIDPLGGVEDLWAKSLRVLHALSFFEDPTRAFRAVRFEVRLGLRLAPESERQLAGALAAKAFERISGDRLRAEVVRWLEDPALVLAILERGAELGLLGVLHGDLLWRSSLKNRLAELREALARWEREVRTPKALVRWRAFLTALVAALPSHQRDEIAQRLALTGDDRRAVVGEEAVREEARRVAGAATSRPHQVAECLERLTEEELLLLWIEGGNERGWVERYVRELRRIEVRLRGSDLVARGLSPGPLVGRALQAVRRARLDGLISPDEEMAFGLEAAARAQAEPAGP